MFYTLNDRNKHLFFFFGSKNKKNYTHFVFDYDNSLAKILETQVRISKAVHYRKKN